MKTVGYIPKATKEIKPVADGKNGGNNKPQGNETKTDKKPTADGGK